MSDRFRTLSGFVLLGVALSACGAPRAVASAPAAAEQTSCFAPSPLYAGLFTPGAVFHYRGEQKNFTDRAPEGERGSVDFECIVSDVQRSKERVSTLVRCDGAGKVMTARFAANPNGLYRIDALPAGAPIENGQLIAAPRPTPVLKHHRPGETDSEWMYDAHEARGAWCFGYSRLEGPVTAFEWCFASGVPARLSYSYADDDHIELAASAAGFVR